VILALAAGILGVGSDVFALPAGSLLLVPDPVPGLLHVLAHPHLLDPLALYTRKDSFFL
jgi:hypothetical protein